MVMVEFLSCIWRLVALCYAYVMPLIFLYIINILSSYSIYAYMKSLITFFACTALLGVMKAVSIYWDADVILLLYHLQWWLYFGHKCKEQLISMHQLINCSFHSVYIPFPLLPFCYLECILWSFSDCSCHRCSVCKRVSAHCCFILHHV